MNSRDILAGLQHKHYEDPLRQEPAAPLRYVNEEGDRITVSCFKKVTFIGNGATEAWES